MTNTFWCMLPDTDTGQPRRRSPSPSQPRPPHGEQLAHARTLAEHSIQPYTEAAYVESMLQDWTKYETEVLEGHTGPLDTTSRTTLDQVVPDGDIRALITTARTTFKDCSRPDHPFGDNNDPAITNAILAYHSWSTQQSIHLHTLHDDRREWHLVGPPVLEFYLHEDATSAAHRTTSVRPTLPQPIAEPQIPPSPTKPQTPLQHEHEPSLGGHSPPANKETEPPIATTTVQHFDKPLNSRHIPDNHQLPRKGNNTRSTATTWRLPTGTIDWKKILPGLTTTEVMRLLTPHQVQQTQAMHLFITTQGTAAIEGTTLGDDDQTPQARPTQAVWINATAGTDPAVDPQPEWTAIHYTLDCAESDPTLTEWRTTWAAEVNRVHNVALDLGVSSCMVKMCPKPPLCGTPKKKFFWRTQKHKNRKCSKKQLIFIYFKENRLPGKNICLPKDALRSWENHDFLFPLPLMLSYENTHELSILSKNSFPKPCSAQHHKKHFLAPLLCARPRANTSTTAQ